jgi:flagellin-like hook-associated protein FlgL
MVMKVSTSMFFDNASKQLGSIQGSLAKTQTQLSTGKQINRPSDAPDKSSLITRLQSEMTRQASYQNNLNEVKVRLQPEETALRNTSNVMYRFKELAVQAANSTNTSSDRNALNAEATQLVSEIDRVVVGADSQAQLEQIVDAANISARCDMQDFSCVDERLINPAKWSAL